MVAIALRDLPALERLLSRLCKCTVGIFELGDESEVNSLNLNPLLLIE